MNHTYTPKDTHTYTPRTLTRSQKNLCTHSLNPHFDNIIKRRQKGCIMTGKSERGSVTDNPDTHNVYTIMTCVHQWEEYVLNLNKWPVFLSTLLPGVRNCTGLTVRLKCLNVMCVCMTDYCIRKLLWPFGYERFDTVVIWHIKGNGITNTLYPIEPNRFEEKSFLNDNKDPCESLTRCNA